MATEQGVAEHPFVRVNGLTGCRRCGYSRGHHPARRLTKVCGDCWYSVRPTEYLPARGGTWADACSWCGASGWAYRVSMREVEQAIRQSGYRNACV